MPAKPPGGRREAGWLQGKRSVKIPFTTLFFNGITTAISTVNGVVLYESSHGKRSGFIAALCGGGSRGRSTMWKCVFFLYITFLVLHSCYYLCIDIFSGILLFISARIP
uniref:Uncharacterized protein n=1 Tax=Trypanosoma congolense (strain IL3000) TaxID=1068625 RepID=G0UNA8_TRYCI|nr:hypothetical protein, unlikely [Trypanosoma congolense IL3000]